MKTQDHSLLIAAVARAALRPLGCFQKGKSRIWLDDHGWWVGVVEFQPSGFSKGSYLNVAAHWLWYEQDGLSFDYGDRVEPFHPFESVDQFEPVALHLANRARDALLVLRSRFSNIEATAKELKESDRASIWNNYHAAIAAGLIGDADIARDRLELVLREKPIHDWIKELHRRVHILLASVRDATKFRSEIADIVRRSRALHKLPETGGLEFSP